ncbi:thiol reductant ABC exporter subunit CydD [Endozoicomonas sp. OPT23]|uniref:heme ABC transporter permease/ATP-binding protein CydD n=1 Tax=Endozoicomonas sp. OPT23 TaxID=2072845 RepID=UPI00129A4F9D|nr:cysteine/glutathione ABC transporter permease/ATP-binding protein CydD [Endozoicomonas sp. OPT23]MRI34854.1 thiol reductant ABC exporter subunit CydD [Endozoicomonas sp. OPT23]
MSQSSEKQAYRWIMAQTAPARKWLMAAVALGFCTGLLFIAQAAVLASIIYKLVMLSVPLSELTLFFVAAGILIVARALCQWGREQVACRAGIEVRQIIRAAILTRLQQMGPVTIASRPAGSWSTMLVEQVDELHDFVARYLPQMALAVVIPLAILLVALPLNWAAAVIFLVTAPLVPIFMAMVGLKAASANRKNFQALERLGGFFLDRLKGMETLRLFQRGQYEHESLKYASEDFRIKTMQVLKLAFLSSTVLEFFASVSIAVLAVYLGMSFLGYLEFGSYGEGVTLFTGLFLLLLAPEFYQPLRDLGTHYHAKAKAVGASELILEFLESTENTETVSRSTGSESLNSKIISIEAHKLSVTTCADSKQLLSDISFAIQPGQKVAIIGSSGAGKTTLLNTLVGFHPYQGQLSIDGQELSAIQPNLWRKQIAWLGQQPLIIHGTLFENVAFGRDLTEQQVMAALEKAQALDIVERLPEGLNSPLQEQGGNLSVGQAQRVALARAIAEPVALLILDEPTASLDRESERQVLSALDRISKNCTTITVTHRLHQISDMDQILMLEQGRLVAAGSPKELAENSSVYQNFVRELAGSFDNA